MKKIVTLLILVLVTLSSVLPASAESKVTYAGKAKEFIFEPGSEYSPTDLFSNFKDVMPGDVLTQKITLKNDASKDVKIKVYLRSLGAQEDSAAFLSQLALTVRKSEDDPLAYLFDAAADQPAQLTDWVCLGTLYSGGELDLDVILTVPVELDNQYQKQIGYLDWEFKIEESPVEDTDPKPPPTGDNAQFGVWISVMAGSLIAVIILLLWRKKGRKNDKTTA